MRSKKFVQKLFHMSPVSFDLEGWFNVTDACTLFDYRLDNWFESDINQRRMILIAKSILAKDGVKPSEEITFESAKSLLVVASKTRKGDGGGTWMHPELAFFFALSVDDEFAFWVKEQIELIAAGEQSKIDWGMTRRTNALSYTSKCSLVSQACPNAGGMTYVKAAREICFACFGTFDTTQINRDDMTEAELTLVTRVQEFQGGKYIEARISSPDQEEIHNRDIRPMLVKYANFQREKLGLPPVAHRVAGELLD